jgi:hypothetical protein
MATSGTVATTTINTAKLIEHAIRRCGLSPTSQTSETMQTARECLYLLMLSLANNGLNLWCVETNYIGLKEGQATYVLPAGTIDLLKLVFSRPSRIEGSDVQAGLNYTTMLDESTSVIRVGVKFNSIAASETVSISHSTDGVVYTVANTIVRTDWAANTWYWFALDPVVDAQYFRVSTLAAIDVADFYLVTSVYDMEIVQYNRDDYFGLPNKQTLGNLSTNYYYERKVNPQVSLWPVPNDDTNHLTIVRHRQIQDIGTLIQEIEIPNRWYEAVIWQLAERLCFELPNVQPTRVPLVQAAAAKNLIEVGNEETDGSSIRFDVQMSGYTR